MELEGVPPGNVHSHEVGLPPERSVYCTVKVTQPSVLFEKKSALGGDDTTGTQTSSTRDVGTNLRDGLC